jgi:hypothetical protein
VNALEQLQTLERDAARRALRESDELVALALAYYNVPENYHLSRGITGEPSEHNRTYRASDNCWNRGMKGTTVGTVTTDGIATVRVIKNGAEAVVPASSFRKQHIATKQRKHNESRRVVAECARLAPIGNVE